MALSGSFYTTGYISTEGEPDKLIFNWEATQDVSTNTSTVTWTVTVGGGRGVGYYNTLSKRYVKVGDYEVTRGHDYLDGTELTVYYGATVGDLGGTTVITHNQDGTGSFDAVLKCMLWQSYEDNGRRYNSTGARTFTLDKIPRKATILSAPNFTDQDSPTVTYNNPAGTDATLRIGISFDGETDDIEYRTAPNSVNGSYTFEFTAEELALLRETATTPTIPIYFLLETTIGSDTFTEVEEKVFSVADTEDNKPELLAMILPDNNDIQAWLPPSIKLWKYIQQLSRVQASITAAGKYDATIVSVSTVIEGQTYSGTTVRSALLQGSGTVPVTITATDSRGHTKTITENITVIAYSYPFLTQTSIVRSDANGTPKNNGENLKLTATRNFSSVESQNGAKIEHRTKRADETWGSQTWTTDLALNASGNTFSGVISGTFNKAVAYTVQVRCIDIFDNSSVLEFDIPTESVVLHLREGGNGMGIGKYNTASGEMQVAYKAVFEDDVEFSQVAKTTLLNMFYPVGTIYTSTSPTSPATLFGGTWTPIEDTFLLAAGQNYTAGDTGGEAEHTLTVDEIPSHDHISKGYMTMPSGGSSSYKALLGNGSATDYSVRATGGDQSHNNMPPYLVVYVWERTA